MVNATDVCDPMIKLGKPKRKVFDVEGKGGPRQVKYRESGGESIRDGD